MGGETQALFIPGWGNSDAGHWQSLWCEELPHARRVVQREWIQVSLDDWVETLDAFVQASDGPVVLVAHSLSCTLVSHWAARHDSSPVRAAMLVAPTDVEADTSPLETRCFEPIPSASSRSAALWWHRKTIRTLLPAAPGSLRKPGAARSSAPAMPATST